jgi:glycosyltransferase involved in cell wall biosynthesis
VYDLDAIVIPPPVSLRPAARPATPTHDVLVVARALPYKNLDLVLDVAALTPDVTYCIVGDGPLRATLTSRSTKNVTWTGSLDDVALAAQYAASSIHLALSHEDFGITPLEAAAAGIPTVARRSGGYLDTITPTTGVLIDEDALSAGVIATTVRAALQREWNTAALQNHATSFSPEHHIGALRAVIDSLPT